MEKFKGSTLDPKSGYYVNNEQTKQLAYRFFAEIDEKSFY